MELRLRNGTRHFSPLVYASTVPTIAFATTSEHSTRDVGAHGDQPDESVLSGGSKDVGGLVSSDSSLQ